MRTFLDVDPRTLHLPPSRLQGADPDKLRWQIHKYSKSIEGMPPIEIYRDLNGLLMVYNGVTRATRVAKFLPGTTIRAELIGIMKKDFRKLPTVEDRLP